MLVLVYSDRCKCTYFLVLYSVQIPMDSCKGILNAMIFYANIMHLGGNQGLFLQFERPNFVSIFIAWLNLDIGFDVCFFKGLDVYIKQWLQLIFPTYLIILVITVIIACNFSSTFAKLIGKRNPVATLATLILLSYARLLNSTIDILSFAIIQYTPMDENDSFKETVWLTDASIPYLSGKHIPLFIVAILIHLVEQQNCNPSHLDDCNVTPLHKAAQAGHLSIVQYLTTEQHCNILCTNSANDTPLHHAARCGHLEVVKFSVESLHCSTNIQGQHNKIPLEQARN